jgi:uncharacterized protein YndB with AHSA1/START domain
MKSINENAPVRCLRSITIAAPATQVWAVLTHINEWDRWQTDISKPSLRQPLKPGSTFVWKTGGATITSTLHTVQPASAFGWTGKTLGIFAIHNWQLSELNGHTTVTVSESMEGWLANLLQRMFQKKLEQGMEKWLELLKAACEK